MRRFYVFWFFFSAGWGYLMSQRFPGVEPKTTAQIAGGLPAGALTIFLLLSLEAWRTRPQKLLPPSVDLKPWQMPMGVTLFVLLTFLFSSFWGVLFGLLLSGSDFREPLFMLLVSAGGLTGVWGAYRAFRTRYVP